MYRQLQAVRGTAAKSPLRRLPPCDSIRFSSSLSDTEDAVPYIAAGTKSEPNARVTFREVPTSWNHLELSLDSWVQKTGSEASKLIRKSDTRSERVFAALAGDKADGELHLIHQRGTGRVFRRLSVSRSVTKSILRKGNKFDGLCLVDTKKDERIYRPLQHKEAAEAIIEIRRRSFESVFGSQLRLSSQTQGTKSYRPTPDKKLVEVPRGKKAGTGIFNLVQNDSQALRNPGTRLQEIRETPTEISFKPEPNPNSETKLVPVMMTMRKQAMGLLKHTPKMITRSTALGFLSLPSRQIRKMYSTYSSSQAEYIDRKQGSATIHLHLPPALLPEQRTTSKNMPTIRERLVAWETANIQPRISNFNDGRVSMHSILEATLVPTEENSHEIENSEGLDNEQHDEADDMLFKSNQLLDFGDERSFLVRGDMIALSTVGRLELAIFIRRLGNESVFYSMAGRLISRQRNYGTASFIVPGFATPQELKSIADYGTAARDTDIPRYIGASLVQKMQEFWTKSDVIFRDHVTILDRVHELSALEETPRLVSLMEIASEVLPPSTSKEGQHSQEALLALYRSLYIDAVGFKPSKVPHKNGSPLFTITSMKQVKTIKFVCEEVQNSQDSASASFIQFVDKSKCLIDESRQLRDLTKHKILGNLKSEARDHVPLDIAENCFSDDDLRYIDFLKACTSWNSNMQYTREFATCSAILRATEKYAGMDLDVGTAWLFLQEIGILSPFTNVGAVFLGVTSAGGLFPEETVPGKYSGVMEDLMCGLRKDWGNLPVYCIDNVEASEIDDGLSIEPANQPGQYWVHCHTAHPGSQITPDGEFGRKAEDMLETLYFPENVVHMLPPHLTRERFSLAPDRPSLTYSARLDINGIVQEHSVTAGILRNVIYITPNTVDNVIEDQKVFKSEVKNLAVGNLDFGRHRMDGAAARRITSAEHLSTQDKNNLKLLNSLADARENRSGDKGAVTPEMRDVIYKTNVRMGVKVNLMPGRPIASTSSFRVNSDPGITLKIYSAGSKEAEGSSLVRNLMLLGGEIAARWCNGRGIPVPYRVTQRNDDMKDPAEFYRQELQSRVAASEPIPLSILRNYVELLGGVATSSTAGPHLTLGLDMFARSTSPLRRYFDLLLQWQVQAALVEEARSGQSLIGSRRDDYLPFTKARIDELLAYNRVKMFDHRVAMSISEHAWTIQFLLRAWKYKEASLPETFELHVTSCDQKYAPVPEIAGYMPYLGLRRVRMSHPKWMQAGEVNENDVYQVEIVDINVYNRVVMVNPLRCIRAASNEAVSASL